jgi:hypothetical protein
MRKSKFSAVMVSLALAPPVAFGAEITVLPDSPVVVIQGDILPNDSDAFTSKESALSGQYVVALQSRGGNPIAAMEIGKFIRMRGWKTYVPAGCLSSCALIWLAGASRAMDPAAKIGVHAASLNGQEIGFGNALIGSYLSRLGYSDSVVAFATMAGPNDIEFITPVVAEKLGIEIATVDLEHPKKEEGQPTRVEPQVAPQAPASWTPESEARFIVSAVTVAGNSENIGLVGAYYDDTVNYYGKPTSRADVIADKIKFAQRWPSRNYMIRQDSMIVKCEEIRPVIDCGVTVLLDWQASNSSKRSSGTASFTYRLYAGTMLYDRRESGLRISHETSTVITRTVTDLGQPAPQTVVVAQGYSSLRTWDRHLPSTKRYIRRELQVGPNAGYRLIATDHDAAGASNGGSTCDFNVSGWSDCVGTAGNHYQLKPQSIRWFLNVAAGQAP